MSKKSKLMQKKIHNESNNNILNKDRIQSCTGKTLLPHLPHPKRVFVDILPQK